MKELILFHQHALLIGSSLLLCLLTVCYIWRRFKRPKEVQVNCWFCNSDLIVPASNYNGWDCPQCEQYNGFDEDGNYNKAILAQHYKHFNQGIFSHQKPKIGDKEKFSNILCDQCNQNQQLKIHQLAMFVPEDERTYVAEIEEYSAHLDSLYQLCLGCELQTQRKIQDVDDWVHRNLLGKRLLRFKNFSSKHRSTSSFHLCRLLYILLFCSVLILLLDLTTFKIASDNIRIQDKIAVFVSAIVLLIDLCTLISKKPIRISGAARLLYSVISFLSRFDYFLDLCLQQLRLGENYLPVVMKPEDFTKLRCPTRIFIDLGGCLRAVIYVIRSHTRTKKRSQDISKPIFADFSRQSSNSSLPRNQSSSSITQDKKLGNVHSKKKETSSSNNENPLNTSLESLSIDGSSSESIRKGIFQSSKERRPLLNPAKLTVSDSVRQRRLLMGDIDTPLSVSLASSPEGSLHDGSVHSTETKTILTKDSAAHGVFSSPLLHILFGVSLGVNITILLGVVFWRSANPMS